MFTGIIEHQGTIESLSLKGDDGHVVIHAPSLAGSLAVSNSIAVNGCCLTVVALENERFTADLSGETMRRTSFGASTGGLKQGARVNLEQPLTAGKEFGGHFVLGHVDGVGHVTNLRSQGESWSYGVQVPEDVARFIVPKGSITIDGISLTVAHWHNFVTAQSSKLAVEIAIIPYTYAQTNIRDRKPGDAVNLEGDVLGKYVERYLQARDAAAASPASQITIARLAEEGF
jgi:riboflavin synthase